MSRTLTVPSGTSSFCCCRSLETPAAGRDISSVCPDVRAEHTENTHEEINVRSHEAAYPTMHCIHLKRIRNKHSDDDIMKHA